MAQSVVDVSEERMARSWLAWVFVDDLEMEAFKKKLHEYGTQCREDLVNLVPNEETIEEASYEELAQAFSDVHKYINTIEGHCESLYFALLRITCTAYHLPHSLHLLLDKNGFEKYIQNPTFMRKN